MVFTERIIAQKTTDSIKQFVNNSNLDFYTEESPYSLKIQIRKKFIVDHTQQISSNTFSSSPVHNKEQYVTNLSTLVNDSGINSVNLNESIEATCPKDTQISHLQVKMEIVSQQL